MHAHRNTRVFVHNSCLINISDTVSVTQNFTSTDPEVLKANFSSNMTLKEPKTSSIISFISCLNVCSQFVSSAMPQFSAQSRI